MEQIVSLLRATLDGLGEGERALDGLQTLTVEAGPRAASAGELALWAAVSCADPDLATPAVEREGVERALDVIDGDEPLAVAVRKTVSELVAGKLGSTGLHKRTRKRFRAGPPAPPKAPVRGAVLVAESGAVLTSMLREAGV